MEIVSWHPVLTDHQSYTLEALQKAALCPLAVYVARTEHPARQEQGWVNCHTTCLSPQLIPQKGWFKYSIQQLRTHQDAVHLFGSPFENPRLIVMLFFAITMKCRVFLISEPYSPISVGYQSDKHKLINWFKALLRPTLYHFYGAILSRRVAGVFAISPLAISQYQNIGIPQRKIFPFGYFVPPIEASCAENQRLYSAKLPLKLVFIGTLIERKGLDLLISAVRNLNNHTLQVTLDVYGSGDPSQFDFDQSTVKYCGLIPFGESQAVIANYDILVLPSRYDGWGVVVNEALMAGIPVVCSHRVGAGAVVKKWQCGEVFASEEQTDLQKKLHEIIVAPEILLKMRLAAKNAAATLNPEVAGRYMFDVIKSDLANTKLDKLTPPWYEVPNHDSSN